MKKTVLLALGLLLASCSVNQGKLVDAETANPKDNFSVRLLFEQDGVRVYRFIDDGYYRYFTIGNGKFSPQVQSHTTTTGKTTTTTHWYDGADQ